MSREKENKMSRKMKFTKFSTAKTPRVTVTFPGSGDKRMFENLFRVANRYRLPGVATLVRLILHSVGDKVCGENGCSEFVETLLAKQIEAFSADLGEKIEVGGGKKTKQRGPKNTF